MKQTGQLLSIDDDQTVLRSPKGHFGDNDLQGVTAANGEEALKLFAEYAIKVAVVDIRLPGMPGIEWIKRIQAGRPLPDIVICIGFENFVIPPEMRASVGVFSKIFHKPLEDLSELRTVVGNLLRRTEDDHA